MAERVQFRTSVDTIGRYAAGFPPVSACAARQPETLADEQRLRLASR